MLGFLFYVPAIVAAIDAVRRPQAQWLAADRNRSFWLVIIILGGALGALVYGLAVLPLLTSASGRTSDDPYQRRL